MISSGLTSAIPVLLVDDRQENLLSLAGLLGGQGYELVTASSGNEALLLILKHNFALVLLDVQMPDMDGFETACLMRANPKTCHIPIIFVTAGMKDLQFQFKGYDAGAVDYLAKPIEPAILQSKVRIFAELYHQRREIEQHRNNLEKLVEQRTSELLKSNRELKATEELLRGQVVEFVETHDQLIATEEMLRIQIEEYQVAQKLLKDSNASLQTLFDVSPMAIIVSSFPDGEIRVINRTFSDNFGYTDDLVIGRSSLELNIWVDSDDRKLFITEMHNQGRISGFATEIRTLQGESRSVLLYSTLTDYKNEKCLLIVCLDVTEQKKMENQIRQTQKMDVIGQLAGGVAHDFNNMLTAIIGSAEMLERHVKDNPAAMKLLGSIQQAAGRSAELTGQLLAFSRKGQKKTLLVRIDTTIHDAISLLERTIDKKITLETRLLAKNTYVNGDPGLLQNALLNLGVNARDAMPAGGVITFATANVDLDSAYCQASSFALDPGPYIEIAVSDTGVGMTKEIIQHIFEPFFTTKEVGKGTGLGMAAVYGTVIEHHGCIHIFSEPGVGTLFKIYLPLSADKQLEVTAKEELGPGSGGVLLVDDEEIILEVGKALLEDLGYRVYTAADGIQALEQYAREMENISVVILDMLMPKMGGKETLVKLKELNPAIRVLISSGFHHEGALDDLVNLGAEGFLQKPYLRQELGKAVAEVIAK